ncbi:MAG: hypothetical protein EBU46_18745 [Nitrosomonadaceae bacterium]|nr:hypothetical protein [Nitrosomonadaceae bacterium]
MTFLVGALIIAVVAVIVYAAAAASRSKRAADKYFVGGDAYLDLLAPGPQGSPYAMAECAGRECAPRA